MSLYRLKGTSGAVLNQAVALGQRILIGSAADCDLVVEGVAPRYAEILVEDDGRVTLHSLDAGNPVRRNGEDLLQGSLASGDELRIGADRWLLQAPGLRPERVLTPEAATPPRRRWLWLVPVALAAAALLAWQRGWIAF